MTNQLRHAIGSIVFAALACSCAAAAAQQPAAPGDGPAPAILAERNPAVLAALEWPRTRPDDAFRAVVVLVDLGRPELAKPILEELHARGLMDPQRAGLVEQFGSYRMLQLARDQQLAPVGGQFAEACMAAAAAAAANPQRLAILVEQLTDPAADVRHFARAEITEAGQIGANAVLEALAREADPARRAAFAVAAARMDPLVVGPLLAMLETNDAALYGEVARLLAALGAPQAAPIVALGASQADAAVAERAIASALDEYERGAHPFALDADGQSELWQWNDVSKSLASVRFPADAARTIWKARLAERLAALRPGSSPDQRRALALSLEAAGLWAKAAGGNASSPANARIQSANTAHVNDVLDVALKSNFAYAAVAAADVLGSRGDAAVLLTIDGQPAPLARAVIHPDRRVRFAALRAIMALDPPMPYPGASRVPEMLAHFARSTGGRDGVVAMPNATQATDVAGKLATAGLDGAAAYRGEAAARLAAELSDLEVILVDMDIQSPGVRDVLYALRATPMSGRTPIALFAGEGRLADAQQLASEHERVIAVPRPYSAAAVRAIVARLLELSARDAVPAEERAAQAAQAVTWIAELLARGRTFYALRRQVPTIEAALYQPSAALPAIDALGRFGTPASQRALVAYASQSVHPLDSRGRAAAAFRESVGTRGLLLTRDEVLAQYAMYNASASADAGTQQVLGAILDAIEQETRGQVSR